MIEYLENEEELELLIEKNNARASDFNSKFSAPFLNSDLRISALDKQISDSITQKIQARFDSLCISEKPSFS